VLSKSPLAVPPTAMKTPIPNFRFVRLTVLYGAPLARTLPPAPVTDVGL
jgi:hypothetical protein